MKFHRTVYFHHLNPITWDAMNWADACLRNGGFGDMIITSISDGVHSARSLHPIGFAWDCRSRRWRPARRAKALLALKDLFDEWHGGIVQVVAETKPLHFHFEVDMAAGRVR